MAGKSCFYIHPGTVNFTAGGSVPGSFATKFIYFLCKFCSIFSAIIGQTVKNSLKINIQIFCFFYSFFVACYTIVVNFYKVIKYLC